MHTQFGTTVHRPNMEIHYCTLLWWWIIHWYCLASKPVCAWLTCFSLLALLPRKVHVSKYIISFDCIYHCGKYTCQNMYKTYLVMSCLQTQMVSTFPVFYWYCLTDSIVTGRDFCGIEAGTNRSVMINGALLEVGIVVTSWPLQCRHNGRDSVSNHQPHDCLLNRLFGRRSKKTSKLRVTGLCAGNSPGTGEFPAQMASNAENVSIWRRHHDMETLSALLSLCEWNRPVMGRFPHRRPAQLWR